MQLETKSKMSGWEVMNQVAAHQGLLTPYQVVVNPDRVSKQTSPLHIIATSSAADCCELQIIVRPLQIPTAPQYHRLMEALYRKDAGEVAKFLGRELDLTWSVPPGGHTSALLTMAMLKDHDMEPYTTSSSGFLLKYPCQNACLTFLLLQAKVDPNILPPKQQPDDHNRFGSSFEEPGPRPIITRCCGGCSPRRSQSPTAHHCGAPPE